MKASPRLLGGLWPVVLFALTAVPSGAQRTAPPQPAVPVKPIAASPAGDTSRAVTIGILREDAILIPFARFDGQTWHNMWTVPPEDGRRVVAPR